MNYSFPARSLALCSAGFLFPLLAPALSADFKPPNFIVILGEGAGWSSSSVQMDDLNPASRNGAMATPNLERFAALGMRFAQGYAASPRCTPSRAALFTGRNPAALKMTFVGDGRRGQVAVDTGHLMRTPMPVLELPLQEITIAELLKKAGYTTAHFGKWHVGKVDPAQHGFDESDGATNNGGPDNVINPNPEQAFAMTKKAVDFLERQARTQVPFYLQMSYYPTRESKETRPSRREAGGNREIALVDQTLGEVLDAVQRLGLASNTYILFTTDHGTMGQNLPLSGGKGSVAEGGLRVPFIVSGPQVEPGSCSQVFVSALDVLPTLAQLARVPLPGQLDGGSFAGVLHDDGVGKVSRPREEFVVHFPHYDKDAMGPASAIYLSGFKLVHVYETGEDRLYDLTKDIGEQNNLARQMPEKTADLSKRLASYLLAVDAQMPVASVKTSAGP